LKLVVDANVLFAALIAKSKIPDLLFSEKFVLYVPEVIFIELEKNNKVKVYSTSDLIKEFNL